MSTYFIADLHLAADRPILTNAFANFYEKNMILNDKVVIVGDLFDFFIGVNAGSHFHQRIRKIILMAKDKGVKTYFIPGNRDFLMDEKSANFFGFKLLKDEFTVHSHEGKVLILHGDQLCMFDRAYRRFKKLTSIGFVRKLFLMMPYDWRYRVGLKLRKQSKGSDAYLFEHNPFNDVAIKEEGRALLKKHNCKIMIHGHFHLFGGEDNSFGPGTFRLGLGAWGSNYSYVKFDRHRMNLELIQRSMEKNF